MILFNLINFVLISLFAILTLTIIAGMSVKAIEADDGYIDSAKIYTIAPKKQYTNTNNNTYTNKNILRIPCSKFLGYAS